MSRKPSVVDERSVTLLKQYIQKKANLQCNNFSDIQQLQGKIKAETDEYLSIQTLNRFFGLIKNEFKPAIVTLNILSKYLHYDSFNEFEIATANKQSNGPVVFNTSEFIRLMFSNIETDQLNEKGLLSIMRNVQLMLKKHPSIADDIYPFLATTEYGRRYFYEQFVNMDALDSNYGEGLKHYIIHAKEREQQLFAYCLLTLRYFLTARYDLFNYYYNKVLEYTIDEVKQFHPFLVGRYYASHVLSSTLNNVVIDVFEEASETFETLNRPADTYSGFASAEYYFGEALLLAQEYDMAWSVFKSGRKYMNQPSGFDKGYLAQYDLMELYAGYFSGHINNKKATMLFESLQTRSLYFIAQDYYSFLLIKLGMALDIKAYSRSAAMQWSYLIEKTGFVFLRNRLATPSAEPFHLMEIKGKKIG